MTSSGTYNFQPSNSSFILNAFDRIQIRPTQLLVEHLQRASIETNLLLAEWANRGVNLWESELQTIPLLQGTATYTLPAKTVCVLVAYISITTGTVTTDRIISPISTYEYGAIPNKLVQSPPTVYWFNRQITPQITLWGVPNLNSTYTLKLQTMYQVQDANLANLDQTRRVRAAALVNAEAQVESALANQVNASAQWARAQAWPSRTA